jgi:hypothetical protein
MGGISFDVHETKMAAKDAEIARLRADHERLRVALQGLIDADAEELLDDLAKCWEHCSDAQMPSQSPTMQSKTVALAPMPASMPSRSRPTAAPCHATSAHGCQIAPVALFKLASSLPRCRPLRWRSSSPPPPRSRSTTRCISTTLAVITSRRPSTGRLSRSPI